MMTVVYDSTGRPVFTVDADIDIAGAVKIENPPEGYYLKSVDPETGKPVFEQIPKTEEEKRLDAIEAQMNALIGAKESEGTA